MNELIERLRDEFNYRLNLCGSYEDRRTAKLMQDTIAALSAQPSPDAAQGSERCPKCNDTGQKPVYDTTHGPEHAHEYFIDCECLDEKPAQGSEHGGEVSQEVWEELEKAAQSALSHSSKGDEHGK